MDKVKIKLIEQLNNVVAQVEKLVTAESFESGESFDIMKEEGEKLLAVAEEYRQLALPDRNVASSMSALKNSLQQLQQRVATAQAEGVAEVSTPSVDDMPVAEIASAAEVPVSVAEATLATEIASAAPAADTVSIIIEQREAAVAEMALANTEQPIFEHNSNVEAEQTVAELEQPILDFTELGSTHYTAEQEDETVATVAEAESIAAATATEPVATAELTTPTEMAEPAAQTITSAFQPLDRLRSLSEDRKSESSSTLHAIVSKLRSVPAMPEIHLDQPIDLRTSIGINEKFLFVDALFKGSIRDCNETMSMLNDLDGLDSAMEKLREYKEKYGWNEDSLAYISLVEVVNQRFSQLVLA